MIVKILFIQGGGDRAYAEDEKLVENLRIALGERYEVRYPKMPNEDDPSYQHWKERLGDELSALGSEPLVVAHSVGGPILLRYLAKTNVPAPLKALFFVAAPFVGRGGWNVNGEDVRKLIHQKKFVDQVTETLPMFFYHNRDDKIVPFSHLRLYEREFPQAQVQAFDHGGHQFDDGLKKLALDIKGL